MSEQTEVQERHSSLGSLAAQNLANVTKTIPQFGTVTPRWLLRLLPWVSVEAGIYRVNRVRTIGGALERVETSFEAGQSSLDPQSLKAVPLLRNLDDPALERLAGLFDSEMHPPGALIVSQESPRDRFFVLASGKAEVWITGPSGGRRSVYLLGPGDFFGEAALMSDDAPPVNVETLTAVSILSLTREEFAALTDIPEVHERLAQSVTEREGHMREAGAEVVLATDTERVIPYSFVDYEEVAREYVLKTIQTNLRVDSKVADLFSSPQDQLQQQTRLAIEAAKERQEWELVNNPEFGLLHNVPSHMRIPTRNGPPTPDDLDELLQVAWKEPAFFIAHPAVIAAFGRECTRRGVPPPTMSLFGSPFLTWRGVPLVPVDKLMVNFENGIRKSSILLLRVGEQRQGVVGLHQPSLGNTDTPSLAIRYNGIDQYGVASYLISLYFSLAILTDDAVGMLEDVEVGRYHDYGAA